jgi:hypothetical protein
MNMPLAYGINFGNPEMHDMEQILKRCAQENKIYYGTIPKQIDESLEEYFTRLLKASRKGDRSMLLLLFHTDMSQREKVMEAWENAGQDSV